MSGDGMEHLWALDGRGRDMYEDGTLKGGDLNLYLEINGLKKRKNTEAFEEWVASESDRGGIA